MQIVSFSALHRVARRLIDVLSLGRGKALAYAIYAAAMLSAGCGLWVLGEREYQARLERLEHELTVAAASVTMLVGSSVDHVDTLQRQTAALLAESSASDSAYRLYSGLGASDSFVGYALDRVPPGQDTDAIANLTGAGFVPPPTSATGREILAALSLNTLLEATHAQVPDAAWVYYTSKNRFMALHPWVPSRDFHWSDDLLTYDFYKLGLPDQDPARAAFWTDLYIDAAGKGLMATVGEPVYDASGAFRGTVDLDLTLGTMSRIMARGVFPASRAFLVTDKDRVIADSAMSGAAPTSLTDLAGLLPDTELRKAALEHKGRSGAFQRYGGWLLFKVPINGAPWRLLLTVDRGALLFHVARSIWIGFAGFIVLAVALVAVEQRRRATNALAANVAALQHMTLDLAGARDEAQVANRAKSMLLANVSHELRTPLNAIIGFSDLMRHRLHGPVGNAKYEGYLNDIHRSGQLLLALINDLLDVTRLEAGRHELAEADCDLTAIVQEAVDLTRMQAERGGVAVGVAIDSDLPAVHADERAMRQIVLNLLSNAVKFTPAGGVVQISCKQDGAGHLALVVKDTGRGIPEEELGTLFHPFARTSAAKRSSTPGTGLGLAIVKSLVELHQGTIEMQSVVDRGTTVMVTLPKERIGRSSRQDAA